MFRYFFVSVMIVLMPSLLAANTQPATASHVSPIVTTVAHIAALNGSTAQVANNAACASYSLCFITPAQVEKVTPRKDDSWWWQWGATAVLAALIIGITFKDPKRSTKN